MEHPSNKGVDMETNMKTSFFNSNDEEASARNKHSQLVMIFSTAQDVCSHDPMHARKPALYIDDGTVQGSNSQGRDHLVNEASQDSISGLCRTEVVLILLQ